jgi:hypothetical protein
LLTLNYLKKTLNKGDKYLAYGDWIAIHTLEDLKSLPTFQTNYEATEYCFENTTDRDYVIQLSVEWAYKAMVAGIEDPSIIVRKGGLINVEMTAFYYADKVENELTKTKKKRTGMKRTAQKKKLLSMSDLLERKIQALGRKINKTKIFQIRKRSGNRSGKKEDSDIRKDRDCRIISLKK